MTSSGDEPDLEIMDPDVSPGDDPSAANLYLAQISNYTDRPDLLIETIEKHDPGFVKRMNQASEHDATEQRAARFKFGKVQAYASLFVSVIAALVLLGILALAVADGQSFWTIVGIGLVYAITQSGTQGFSRLVESVSDLLRSKDNKTGNKDN